MLKGMLDKLRKKDEAGSSDAKAPEGAEGKGESSVEAKTEVTAPNHTPGLKETAQLSRAEVQALLNDGDKEAAPSPKEAPKKASNYDTLPETVQLDRKRVQEILRQHKASDSESSEGGSKGE